MKTIDIEIAIMKFYGVRQNLIVPNVYWGMDGLNYECDLVKLSKSDYATEIEIKVSKSDLLKDKHKFHDHDSRLFSYLYFAVPHELEDIALSEIPERSGLFTVTRKFYEPSTMRDHVRITRTAKRKKPAFQWSKKQRSKLAELGSMRILGLKEALVSQMNNKQFRMDI